MLQLSAVIVVIVGIVLLGLFGFGILTESQIAFGFSILVAGGYVGFRQAIESTGYKTLIISGAMILFGLLYQVWGFIPLDKFLIIEGILGTGGVAAIVHASNKQGEPTAANKIQ